MHISSVRREIALLRAGPFLLFFVDKLVMLPISYFGSVNTRQHKLAVFVEAPIALVNVVVCQDAVYRFDVKTVLTLVSCDKLVLKQGVAEYLFVGLYRKGDRLLARLYLNLNCGSPLAKLGILALCTKALSRRVLLFYPFCKIIKTRKDLKTK